MKRSSFIFGGLVLLVFIALLTNMTRAPKAPQAYVPPAPPPVPPAPQAARGLEMTGCTPKALTVLEPQPGATVTSPVTVRVRVENASHPNCRWIVFEAVAGSLTLQNAAQATVGNGILMTSEDWMTDGPVEFTGTIPVAQPFTGPAKIVITEEDPSGEGPSETITIPVNF